jgi:hypothetical protein
LHSMHCGEKKGMMHSEFLQPFFSHPTLMS